MNTFSSSNLTVFRKKGTFQTSSKNPLYKSILRTLCYAQVFSFALTKDELYRYLITKKAYSKQEVTNALRHLLPKWLVQNNGYITLKGEEDLCKNRAKMSLFISQYMREVQHLIQCIGWLPTISALYITGGLSVENVQEHDDIDVMIVTRPGWLWFTRLCVIFLTFLQGKYRHKHTKHITKTWCFNLWLDETALTLPLKSRNLYTAHEVVQAKPVLDKARIHARFLQENLWAKQYLPHAFIDAHTSTYTSTSTHTRTQNAISFTHTLNTFFFTIQQWYMASSKTREKVGLSYAFFHPRNTKKYVIEQYYQLIKSLKPA